MPKGFTEHEKALIRRRLLEQGDRQFSAYGLRKTTVEELAAAVGISKGAFYLFFESKEALFMAVAEETVEQRLRGELLAAIDRPGPSPRARLLALFNQVFALFKSVPMLRFFTGSDYDLLLRRLPPEQLQQHLAADRVFFEEFVARCRQAGIPVQVRPEEIGSLLYALILGATHEDEWGAGPTAGAIDVLLELVAAFALGEITLQAADPLGPAAAQEKDAVNEPGD
jgi:AcrR family transcriptional regulator